MKTRPKKRRSFIWLCHHCLTLNRSVVKTGDKWVRKCRCGAKY